MKKYGKEKVMLAKFTKELCDLFVGKNVGLSESLEIMKFKPEKKLFFGDGNIIQMAADYIYMGLAEGKLLSNALKSCPYINFPQVYISFILLAERTGDLRKTISFLNEKCKREKENRNKLVTAFIYPGFVILLAFCACIFLCNYAGFNLNQMFNYFLILILVCIVLILIIKKVLSENKIYEAFLAAGFLIDSGASVLSAVECSINIVGPDSKCGKVFLDVKEKLEYGMDLFNAFRPYKEFEEAFYFADKAGSKADVFEKIAIWMKENNDRKRNFCLILIEPLFIAVTGAFLLLLVMKFFLPYMNDFSWI